MIAAGTDIASLPVRTYPAALPQLLPAIPGYPLHRGPASGAFAATGNVPQFLAASLRSSFLRYAVLLI